MKDYEFVKLGPNINGLQTVEFYRRNDRPNDPLPEGALLKARTIERPLEQTGTTIDEITGEEVPVMSVVPDKYIILDGENIIAMTAEQRATIDAYEQAQYVEANRNKWEAENAFLGAVAALNNTYNLNLEPTDGFQDVLSKLKASTTGTQVDRLQAGVELNTLWDRCAYHGTQWGEATYHPEVAE